MMQLVENQLLEVAISEENALHLTYVTAAVIVTVPRDSSCLTLMLGTKPFLIRYEQLDNRSK